MKDTSWHLCNLDVLLALHCMQFNVMLCCAVLCCAVLYVSCRLWLPDSSHG
jgi:hypothetical protein